MADQRLGRVMQELTEKVRRTGNKAVLRQILDEVVFEVNRGGVRRQLRFLVNVLGLDRTQDVVNTVTTADRELFKLSRRIDNPEDIICAIYDECVADAHELMRGSTKEQLRFLTCRRGFPRVEKLVHKE